MMTTNFAQSWLCTRLALAAALSVLLSISSFAQTPAPSDENTERKEDPLVLKVDVVVTGTRTDITPEKAPVSTSVVNRQELQIRNSQTLDQSLDLLGGLYVLRTKGAADTNTRINMRGFNGANRTLVLLDGQPVNDAYTGEVAWTSLPNSEVDRVEVVRGPFSSLYGGNAMGGVINILTRPITRRDIEASAQGGTYGTQNYSGRFAEKLTKRLGFSLGAQRLRSDGYQSRAVTTTATTGTTGTRVSGVIPTFTTTGGRTYQIGWGGSNWYSQYAIRAKGEYTFGTATLASFQYVRQSSGYGYEGYTSQLRDANGAIVDRGPVLFDDNGTTRALTFTPGTFISGPGQARSNLYSGALQHVLNSRSLVRVTAGIYDQPDNNFRTPTAATASLTGGPGAISLRASRNGYANAQYTWVPSARHTVIAGADVRREQSENEEFSQSNWTNIDERIAQTYASSGRTSTAAFYIQDQVQLGDRLTVVAGGRFDHWRTYDGLSNTYTAASPLTTYPERANNATTGKLSAAYQPTAEWTLRGSVGTAFRSPTVYDLYRTFRLGTTLFIAEPTLTPESLLSGEVGVSRRFGTRVSAEATWFRNRITDMIYRKTDLVADPTGATRINVNAGEGRTNGVELAGRARLTSFVELRATYSFTDAIISKNTAVPVSEGKKVPYVPTHMSSLSAVLSKGKWSGSVSARYAGLVSNSDTNADTTRNVPGSYNPYFLMDASASYRVIQHLDVFASADNLLDRQYYLFYLNPGRALNLGARVTF
ncbi:MAG: TonB-dependent receptor [Vicinamibacterales bacterium]